MGRPAPNPEHVAQAWELFRDHKSLREIAEILESRGIRASSSERISHETVRQWLARARDAEAWMVARDEAGKADERDLFGARYMSFLEQMVSAGIDRMSPAGGGSYEQVAPVAVRAAMEYAKAARFYAPTRIEVEGSVLPPSPDPQTAAIVAVMEERARELATAEGRALLTGEKESPDVAPQ